MPRHIDHRRQYERRSVDVQVQLVIADAHLDQVTPTGGPALPGRMRNISAGGALVVVSTYLPRSTQLELEIPAATPVPAGRALVRVMSIQMVDREPHYTLGLRFEDSESELVGALQAWCSESRPLEPTSPGIHAGVESQGGAKL
jgi:hypothetical protein